MTTNDILLDGFSRVEAVVHRVLAGLNDDDTGFRPDKAANSIAWLMWHLTRIQDDHIADLIGAPQVYVAGSWAEKFNLPFDVAETGWGHTSQQVGEVVASAKLLGGYYDAVHQVTVAYLKSLQPDDYGRIVDERWDPPVTLGVRLVSIIADDLQHAGQAAYVRGLLDGR